MAFYDVFLKNTFLLAIIPLACILFIIYTYTQKFRNVPPGPWGIPLLGYWPFLKSDSLHLQLQEMKKRYGEIFSLSVAGKLHIFLSSMKILKEAHLSKAECFGERFSGFSLLEFSFKEGVSMANGESWKVQRKFFHQKFKEYGMLAVKEHFSSSIYDTLNETVDEMRAEEGKPLPVADLLTSKCCSIIRRILFNDQGLTEEELRELNAEYDTVLVSMTSKNMLLVGNIAKYLVFPFMTSYRAMARSHNRIIAILTDIIKRHKAAFDKTQVMDIIDSFYNEKHERETKGDPTAVYFTDQALLSSVYQFVTDGTLSVVFFIVLMLQSLIEHPEEQEKMYEELSEVIGPERQPTMEDKNNLPYTNGFIYETIRCSNLFPAFCSLQCTKETSLNGYRIPKGAITVLNMAAIHRDPDIYEDPFKFNPCRFSGKQRADLPVTFGIGKRACLGEPFIAIQLFLFVATIVKNFRLLGVPDEILSIPEFGEMKIYANARNQEAHSKTN